MWERVSVHRNAAAAAAAAQERVPFPGENFPGRHSGPGKEVPKAKPAGQPPPSAATAPRGRFSEHNGRFHELIKQTLWFFYPFRGGRGRR